MSKKAMCYVWILASMIITMSSISIVWAQTTVKDNTFSYKEQVSSLMPASDLENENFGVGPNNNSMNNNFDNGLNDNYDVDAPLPDVIPGDIVYSKPVNMPSLRQYDINKDGDMWRAQKPQSYITPNDEWVKYIASQLYINEHGRIAYKNRPIPLLENFDGKILAWTDEPFFNNYMLDNELFNFPANADLWQNADYYLSHGMRGDCEDWAIAIVSMMSSGEMSLKISRKDYEDDRENNSENNDDNWIYVKQVIPAKVVLGLSGGQRDAWVEYSVYRNRYFSSTGTIFNQGTGKDESITTFHSKEECCHQFEPIYQFTSEYFGDYKNDLGVK